MARRALVALTFLCLGCSAAFAQSTPIPSGVQRRPGMPPRDRRPEPAAGTASISGRITAAETGTPLRRAQVRVTGQELRGSRSVMTDPEGRFVIDELAAGSYSLSASKAGYVHTQYGPRNPNSPGTTITLQDGQKLEQADVALQRGGAIMGFISDEFGEPVADARIQALQLRWWNGRRRPMPAGRHGETNDRGEFRVWGLPPGQYIVSAIAEQAEQMRFGDTSKGDTSGYAPTYFPGTPVLEEAQHVSVAGGQEAAGVSFALTLTRTVRIAGTVLGSNGKPMTSGGVMLAPRAGGASRIWLDATMGGRIDNDGSFTVSGVAPGEYTMWARSFDPDDPGSSETAYATVTIGAEDIPNLVLVATKGVRMTGRNRLTSVIGSVRGDRNQPVESYVVLVFSTDDASWRRISQRRVNLGRPDQNGVYRVRGLAPGAYYAVAVPDLPEEWGNPELMERLAPLAERFTLAEGESRSLDLTLKP